MSANDVRTLETMNPIEGEGGDEYVMQSQFTTLEDIADPDEQEPPPALPPPDVDDDEDEDEDDERLVALAESHRDLFEDAYGRIIRVETDKLARAHKAGKDTPEWLDKFYTGHVGHVRSVLGAVVDACGSALWLFKTGKPVNADLRQRFVEVSAKTAERYCDARQAGNDMGGLSKMASWNVHLLGMFVDDLVAGETK